MKHSLVPVKHINNEERLIIHDVWIVNVCKKAILQAVGYNAKAYVEFCAEVVLQLYGVLKGQVFCRSLKFNKYGRLAFFLEGIINLSIACDKVSGEFWLYIIWLIWVIAERSNERIN